VIFSRMSVRELRLHALLAIACLLVGDAGFIYNLPHGVAWKLPAVFWLTVAVSIASHAVTVVIAAGAWLPRIRPGERLCR